MEGGSLTIGLVLLTLAILLFTGVMSSKHRTTQTAFGVLITLFVWIPILYGLVN